MAGKRTLSPTHEAPYRGLRVLDFGQGIASPYCAMLLGVYGAEIIKIEPPEGDWSRFLGTTYGNHTTLSAVFNRGKRSLCLDMKNKDAIAIARRLAGDCDVLIEGFRPGVAARLGIGYEELSRDNPSLIYLSVSAFGQSGPYSKRPGSDSVAQAFSGLVSINGGNDKVPHRVGTPISDVVTGVYGFQAIATTLFARATVGTGRWIDVNLCQSTAALLGHKVAEHILEGGAPRALNVPAGSYQTADGWMMVTLVNEPQYKRLCAAIGRDDLASDPRFADFARRGHDRPVAVKRTAVWQTIVGNSALQIQTTWPRSGAVDTRVNDWGFVRWKHCDRDVVTGSESGIARGESEYVRTRGCEGRGRVGGRRVRESDCCWSTHLRPCRGECAAVRETVVSHHAMQRRNVRQTYGLILSGVRRGRLVLRVDRNRELIFNCELGVVGCQLQYVRSGRAERRRCGCRVCISEGDIAGPGDDAPVHGDGCASRQRVVAYRAVEGGGVW